jgi:hypothetical protein
MVTDMVTVNGNREPVSACLVLSGLGSVMNSLVLGYLDFPVLGFWLLGAAFRFFFGALGRSKVLAKMSGRCKNRAWDYEKGTE